jgi:uncharacterized protein (DUF1684 family)
MTRIEYKLCSGFIGGCLALALLSPLPGNDRREVSNAHVARQVMVQSRDTLLQSYVEEIRAWHERRIANLKREHGWLSLVGLDWLKEGENEIPSVGRLTVNESTVTLRVSAGVTALLNGKPLSSGVLRTDAEKGGPDKVVVGSRAFVIIKRGDRRAVRMWDSSTEARKKFVGIECYPISTSWRVEARWAAYDPPKRIKIPSVIPDYLQDYDVPGVAVFEIEGVACRLEPVLEEGESDLFFIFGDRTNGRETYGAGRFLYAKPPEDGKVVLDFNKAYNPPCAFSPYATCPLPPPSNRLLIRIEAGEKAFEHH